MKTTLDKLRTMLREVASSRALSFDEAQREFPEAIAELIKDDDDEMKAWSRQHMKFYVKPQLVAHDTQNPFTLTWREDEGWVEE